MDVTFVIPDEPEFTSRVALDPDRDWQIMRRKQRWVLQTFLRLSHAGYPVLASSRPPERGIAVFHARHGESIFSMLAGYRETILVAIRGDYRESLFADFEVVQNGRWADGNRNHFIPYWPQPGLIPRDPSRGDRVECVSFKGFDLNLHPYFRTGDWTDWVHSEGYTWSNDSLPHGPSERDGVRAAWHDYGQTDVIVALRPDPRRKHELRGYTAKPASKLTNAWHARTVAILGPEYAFRECRRSPLDFIEIDKPEDAKGALSELRRRPDLFRAMIENGVRRAEEFSQERIVSAWADLLFEHIPRQRARRGRGISKLPRTARALGRWCRRVAELRPPR